MFVGIAINLTGRLLSSASPAALFANGEVGVWYDPSQINTLFQDSAGTTPVTGPNQTVGLMLDKSQGLVLGPELIANGNFSSATGWTLGANWAISGGTLNGTTATSYSYINTPAGLVAGMVYYVSFDILSISSGSVYINVGGISQATFTTLGSKTARIVVAAGPVNFVYVGGTGFTGSIDNLSVKLLPGNHATQATPTQRPIYGINPITGTRNLLTYTEQFDNAVWNKANVSISANASTAPDGSLTADLATSSSAAGYIYPNPSIFAAAGGNTYTHSVYIKAGTATSIQLLVAAAATYIGTYNLSTGVASTATANTTVSMVDAGGGWYRCIITCGSVANNAYTELQMGRVANGLTFSIWGAQLEISSTATAYQKVVSQYEVTQAGVASASYLVFDGVDDFMVTGTITPGIDKAQVFAGVRKLSNPTAILAELSASIGSNAGSFYISTGLNPDDGYGAASRGSLSPTSVNYAFATPSTAVIQFNSDIVADSEILRINGVQQAQSTADQGTGNYLAYPLYIGRRGGSSLPFTGRLYSLIVRFGPNLTTGQITSTESWVNGETGAY